MGNKIWSETWMDLRGYELNVVPSSTAKRFSPMPTSSDSCGEPEKGPPPRSDSRLMRRITVRQNEYV